MRLWRLLRLAPFAAAAWSGAAQACIDGSQMAYYFSIQPPERHGETVMLRVVVAGIEGNVVHARLDGSYARLSPDGAVRIELPSAPVSGECVAMGELDGPVFVIGTLIRYHSGRLVLEAVPVRAARAQD